MVGLKWIVCELKKISLPLKCSKCLFLIRVHFFNLKKTTNHRHCLYEYPLLLDEAPPSMLPSMLKTNDVYLRTLHNYFPPNLEKRVSRAGTSFSALLHRASRLWTIGSTA